jgi:hypothetical protein
VLGTAPYGSVNRALEALPAVGTKFNLIVFAHDKGNDSMAEPWDIPPFPEHGDDNTTDTYTMLGQAVSEWGEMEYALSHLYAQLIGKPSHIPTMRRYGEGKVFAERAKRVLTAADKFFVAQPSQDLEGGFSDLIRRVLMFAQRRNEIAHGVVRPLQWIQPIMTEYDSIRRGPLQYAVVPPLFTDQKLDAEHRPKYIYTANELMRFVLAFSELGAEAVKLRIAIASQLPP